MSALADDLVASRAASYVPHIVRWWGANETRDRQVLGSLVSADIAGFTALSERLARFGREGAETLTTLLNECFGGMIEIIHSRGGDVLKFGGDALLVLFTGPDHAARAGSACVRMRRLIERNWSTNLVKRVKLAISQGIHSGVFDLHLVDAGFEELLVVGPGMSETVRREGAAERGQILVTDATADLLDPAALGVQVSDGWLIGAEPRIEHWPEDHEAAPDAVERLVPEWLLEQIEAGRVAEHRVVSVGFILYGGVDSLMEAHGPTEGSVLVHDRLQALATATREAATRHGVHWLASDVYAGGGKIILAAGAPRSTGHDEDAAVRTLRQILDADVGLPLRAGLNRGPVFMGDLGSDRRRTFTVMGDTVNLAARLMQKSAPGQLVVSQAALDHVPTRFVLEPLEPFLVKGKSHPINASLVGAQLETDTVVVPTVDATAPFVGREAELDELATLLSSARTGRGRLVDVVGEPGIGKTRLVTEFLGRHSDATVLRTSGGAYSRNTPFFALSTMLRQLVGIDQSASAVDAGARLAAWVEATAPQLVEWMPLIAIAFGAEVPMTSSVDRIAAANRAAHLRDVLGDLLTVALPGPTVLVVDDAHRLDEASSAAYAALARRASHLPWLVLALRHAGQASFAAGTPGAAQVAVGPLSTIEAQALANAAARSGLGSPDAVPELVERGVTNPLFLLELLRFDASGAATTPDSIEALLTARIDTLGASDRLLLREASVLGAIIDVDLLADATGNDQLRRPDRWRSLSGFLERQPDGKLRFLQSLYRQVAYDGLSFHRRRKLHGDVGRMLERRTGNDASDVSELLSLHFHEARMADRSWHYSVLAGHRARSKYAPAEAAQFYRRALSAAVTARPSHDEAAEISEALADALEITGRFDEADAALVSARSLRREPATIVRLQRKRGVVRERQGRYTQALQWYGRGLRTATQLDATGRMKAEGEIALAYAGVRFRQGRMRDCIRWAHRAERLARQLDSDHMLAHASYLLMSAYGVLRLPQAARYRDVPLPLFERLGDLVGQANVLNNLGISAKEDGKWAEALELYRRSRAARVQVGDVVGAATATNNIAEILSDQGHVEEAAEMYEEALRAFRRAGYPIGVAVVTSYLGRLQARRGEFELASAMLADAVMQFETIGASHFVLETKLFQLESGVLAGNAPAVVAAADALGPAVAESGDPMLELILWRATAWALHLTGDRDEADALAARCVETGDAIGASYESALALILRASIAQAAGGDPAPLRARARERLEQLGVVSLPRLAS